MVATVISAAVITPSVTTPIPVATVVITRTAVVAWPVITTVVIRRVIAGIVVGGRIRIVGTGVVITTGQTETEHRSQQRPSQRFLNEHGGLLKDPRQQSAQTG
jgi:hypothetical protein